MQLSLPFSRRTPQEGEDARSGQLRTLLYTARKTEFYARRLKHVARKNSGDEEDRDPAEVLASVPPLPLRIFELYRDRFTNPRGHAAIAALDRVHTIPNGWRAKLGFPAEAIAGRQDALAKLAGEIESGSAESPARDARRLVVYTGLGDALLTSELRDRFWQAFELPVFEELRGLEDEVLATECEAHEGLHLQASAAVFEEIDGELAVTSLAASRYPVLRLLTGLAGRVERGTCACGASVDRFLAAAEPVALRKPPAVEWQGAVVERRFASAG